MFHTFTTLALPVSSPS